MRGPRGVPSQAACRSAAARSPADPRPPRGLFQQPKELFSCDPARPMRVPALGDDLEPLSPRTELALAAGRSADYLEVHCKPLPCQRFSVIQGSSKAKKIGLVVCPARPPLGARTCA